MFNDKFIIKENLTFNRRVLFDRVESELTDYKYGWVRNGNIYVRKDNGAQAIRVSDETVLDELLRKGSDKTTAVRPVQNIHSQRESVINSVT